MIYFGQKSSVFIVYFVEIAISYTQNHYSDSVDYCLFRANCVVLEYLENQGILEHLENYENYGITENDENLDNREFLEN